MPAFCGKLSFCYAFIKKYKYIVILNKYTLI